MATEKIQSIKVKKTITVQDNVKTTLTNIAYKKWKLNEMPNANIVIQGDEGSIQPE